MLVIERPSFAFIYPCYPGLEVKAAASNGLIALVLNSPSSATLVLIYTTCLDLGLGAYFAKVHDFPGHVRLLALGTDAVDVSCGSSLVRVFVQSSDVVPMAVAVTLAFRNSNCFARLKKYLPFLSPMWAERLGRSLGLKGCGWLALGLAPSAVDATLEPTKAADTIGAEFIYPKSIHCPYIAIAGPAVAPKTAELFGIADVQLALRTLLSRVPCPKHPACTEKGASTMSTQLEKKILRLIQKNPSELFEVGWPYLVKRGLEDEPESFLALRLLPLGHDEGWSRRDTQSYVSCWLKRKTALCIQDQGKLEDLKMEVRRFVARPNVGLLRGLRDEFSALLGADVMEEIKEAFSWEEDEFFVKMRKALVNVMN